ncbi:MAG: hypothetical protein ACI4MQ_00020 [Candidatus Coproplasma sp.]
MEGKNKRNRRSSGSSSVGVGIVAFLLGFLFAFIVLIGSIFGVGYVAVTTDINEVFRVFGLENVKENPESDDDKYNYINADTAPDILSLIQEIMKMANDGLGELNLNKIDALAPVTDAVLDMAYGFIDEVVDFDKEYFEDVPLTSIIDCVTNSVYYIRTAKVVELLNSKMGYSINLDEIPIASYLINGVEAQYATIKGGDENYKLPVLFDYYIQDEGGIGYNRTIPVGSTWAYPTGLSTDYITETSSKDNDGKTLYKVYYVPCKVTATGIEEAEYKVVENNVKDANVSFTKNGETVNLSYNFRTIEYGADTVFIAVKPQTVNGQDTFVLDYDAIRADETSCSYFADYATNYYSKAALRSDKESDRMYGVTTINNINYFRNVAGEIVEYDPLTLSDIMLGAMDPLYQVPVSSLVGSDAEVVKGIFGDTSLGAILNNEINFKELINKINLSTFLSDVSVTDKVMSYIVYNISNVTDDGHGNYTAIYDKGGENEKTVTLEVADGKIKSVKDGVTGETLDGNTVADLTTITLDLTLDIFLDVKADDAIMAYLGYGIKDVVEVSDKDWQYEGTYGKGASSETVRIYTDNSGIITKVTDESGNAIKGTTIDEVSDRVNNIMDVISIPDLMDINPEEAIMTYLGYGVYDVEAKSGTDGNGKAYTYVANYKDGDTEIPVYISTKTVDAKQVIDSVWKADGTTIGGTKANDVSDLLNNVDQALSVTEFIDVKATDAIMTYVGYGVYGIESTAGGYVGKYEKGGVELSVSITVDGSDIITSVVDENGEAVAGTKIGEMPDRISSLQDKLTIGDIIEVNSSSSLVLQAIAGSTINGLNDKINTLTIGDVVEVNDDSSMILKALKDTTINGLNDKINTLTIGDVVEVTDSSSMILKALKDTTINGLNDKINTLTIGDVVEVTDSSSMILKALKDTTINGLNDKINTLTIGDVVEVNDSSSMILKALKDTTINGLDDKINTLTVKDVLTEEQIEGNSVLPQLKDTLITDLGTEIDKVLIQRIYAKEVYGLAEDGDPALVTDATFNPAYLYYELVDGSYDLVTSNCPAKPASAVEGSEEYKAWETAYDNALGKLTQEDWNSRGDKQYYTYGEAKGMWKLILYRVDGSTKTEKAYTLNNFNNMVNSCAETVYNSTLGELQGAKIIGNDIDLSKKLKTVEVSGYTVTVRYLAVEDGTGNIVTVDTEAEGTPISGFTLKQLLVAITSML